MDEEMQQLAAQNADSMQYVALFNAMQAGVHSSMPSVEAVVAEETDALVLGQDRGRAN